MNPPPGRPPPVTTARPATGELDPLIHVPTRLKIVTTLAAQPGGGPLSFTHLQNMTGLTPGNLIIHLRKLEKAGYLAIHKTSTRTATKTTAALTGQGRAALGAYTQALRDLLGSPDGCRRPPRPAARCCSRATAADASGAQDGAGLPAGGAGTGPSAGSPAPATPPSATPASASGTHRATRKPPPGPPPARRSCSPNGRAPLPMGMKGQPCLPSQFSGRI
jgi:DNA-binding transcriptional ArsR family regulator